MGDMKKLLENWRGYEKGVLNELGMGGAAEERTLTSLASSGSDLAGSSERATPEPGDDSEDWLSTLQSINRMGVPTLEEFDGIDPEVMDSWLAEEGLTREDLEEAFLLTDIIFDPEDPIDYVAAGMTAFPEPTSSAAGAIGLGANRIRKLGTAIWKIPKAIKTWNAMRKWKKSSLYLGQVRNKLVDTHMAKLTREHGLKPGQGRSRMARQATEEAVDAGVGPDKMPGFDRWQNLTRPWLDDAAAAAAKGADDVAAAATRGADDVAAAKKTTAVDKTITAMDTAALAGAAWVGTGLTPDLGSPSGEVTPVKRVPFAPANSADGDPANDTENATDPHPGESGTSAGSTQGTPTSQNATPAPLNPTPHPSGECPDGQIWVSSPLGGGCQTPAKTAAKTEGYDIKKIIAEELESFFNKREL